MPMDKAPPPWSSIPIPPQAPAYEGYADLGAVQAWYWDTGGEGEVIVLNHPWSMSSEAWKYQQPVFAAAGYRVIGWSRRGFYKTEIGPEDDLGTIADDQKRLLDVLGIDKCHMVGCAAGGVASINFAVENPERLHSLILSGSVLLPDEEEYRQMRSRTALPPGHNAWTQYQELGPSYRGANPEGCAIWRELEHQAHPNGLFTGQPWGAAPITWARMEQLDLPVLLATGDADHGASAALQRLFAQHLPNRELAVIQEAGHAPYWEQPQAFNAMVLDFIARHSPASERYGEKPTRPDESESPWLPLGSSTAPTPSFETGPVTVWNHRPVPKQAPAKEGYADTSPVKLWHWDTGGDGEAIIFCHPWSQSSECWKYQQPVLAAAGYRVIAWCQRGFYKSERGPEDDPGSTSGDLHQLVEWLGLGKFHLVGCAAGGVTAVSYAINHPERLHSLVLSGSILLPDEPDYQAFRENLSAAAPGEKAKIPSVFTEVGASYRAGDPEGLEEWKQLEHLALAGGVYRSQPWGAERNFANFAKIGVPTLLQTGDTDMSGPRSLLRLYAPHFPGCETRVLSECGHAPYWEQPDAFNASLLDFIGRNGAAKAAG